MENLESQKLLQDGLKIIKKKLYHLYLEPELKNDMNEVKKLGVNWQDKIRNYIKGEIQNERDRIKSKN